MMRGVDEMEARSKFKKAHIEDGESRKDYCTRLSNLFTKTYPQKNYLTSKTLLNKYKRSVDKEFKDQLQIWLINKALVDEEVTWKLIVKFARIYDELHRKDCKYENSFHLKKKEKREQKEQERIRKIEDERKRKIEDE